MSKIKIKKLTKNDTKTINIISKWHYKFWGEQFGDTLTDVKNYFKRCSNSKKIPQTYIAYLDKEVVGTYSIVVDDDIKNRPDIFPYFANLYVREDLRLQGIGSQLIKNVDETCRKLGIKEIWLYTTHNNLYEKFGWKFQEYCRIKDGSKVKIYKKVIKQ